MKYFEPSITSLRLVTAISQVGKLTHAAAELNMSQSAASHALSTLELQLGSHLFARSREGLRLSEAGARLLPLIEATLSNLERIRAEAAGLNALDAGSLRIASVPSILSTLLPPILREYSTRFPGLELSIFEGTDDEVLNWTKSGVAQVGFVALPVEGVASEEIARDEWLALVPERLFRNKACLTLNELSRHRFLMSGGGCERQIRQMFTSAAIEIRGPMMVKEMSTIHAMVAQSLGVSLVPGLSVKLSRACKALPLKPRLFRQIGMIWSTASAKTPQMMAWDTLIHATLKPSKKTTSGRQKQL